MMRFDIMTLFPDMVMTVLCESIIGRAQKSGAIEVYAHNFREYSEDKHHNVDGTPSGGGMGMLLTAPPIYNCYSAICNRQPEGVRRRVIYMSPRGKVFNHEKAKELAEYDNLIFLCGHYEGVDQRVLDEIVDEEISIGDFVLTGGEIPACIVVDAVARLVDGVLSDPECYEKDSIATGLLEHPQYTRPAVFRGRTIPAVVTCGNHGLVDEWRLEQSLALTKENRPDLYEKWCAENAAFLAKWEKKKKRREEKAKLEK